MIHPGRVGLTGVGSLDGSALRDPIRGSGVDAGGAVDVAGASMTPQAMRKTINDGTFNPFYDLHDNVRLAADFRRTA